MSPERHHWKPAVQAAAVDVENASVNARASSVKLGFALCCHSNATGAPIANPPNSAPLGGSLYHAAKLRPGPCSGVGVRPRTDRHTDRHTDRQIHRQTRVTTIHFASSTTHAECNEAIEYSRLCPGAQRIVRLHSRTQLCAAKLTAEGFQSAGGNAERGGAEALKLRPSLRCLPMTDIPRP